MSPNRELLKQNDPAIYEALIGEEKRQQAGIELIPSENYTYPEVLEALGSIFTNKYSEGYPGRRYYGGQEFTDIIEDVARDRAKQLFRCEHANVQPLSGSPMNQAVYMAFLQPGDTVLGMDLSHGGHLTHGAPVSHMGKIYNFIRYKTLPEEKGRIDFDALRKTALESKPKMVLCGYSSYPRDYDYAEFKKIADEVGALTMADVSHIGGLIAGGAMRNPCDAGFDFVTTTTHKSMRGPRGGMILCKAEHRKAIDKSVFPGLQGGPHMNAVAGVAITLGKALEPEYKQYCTQVLTNAHVLAQTLMENGANLITGGTENHMMVIDTVASFGINGRVAEEDARCGVHHDEQTDHPGRPQPAAAPQRCSPGHSGGNHPRHERARDETARPVDHQSLEEPRRSGGATVHSSRSRAALSATPRPGNPIDKTPAALLRSHLSRVRATNAG